MAYVIGMTGGIGSGKSAAAQAFADRGVTIVDSDALAHELTRPGGAGIGPIRAAFGDGFIASDGSLDRPKMRQRVFNDPADRQRLESILHPLIRAESSRLLAEAHGPYAMLVVPLLVEAGADPSRYQRVLVIDADETTQLSRLKGRGLALDEIRRIIASQATRRERLAAADDVLENNGTLEELDRKVETLHRRYLDYARRGDAAP